MSIDKQIKNCIYEAIDEVNILLPDEKKLKQSLDVVLFGKGVELDSLNIINFIITLERSINTKFSIENFSLLNDSMSEQDIHLFNNGLSLLEFIKSKLNT